MAFLDVIAPYLDWELSRWGAYGLFFLLGTFVVASVSDVKHLSAQKEFLDVWLAFVALMLLLDFWQRDWRIGAPFVVKWLLVLVLSALTHRKIGVLLRLATADVAAMAAAAALLSPLLVVAFFAVVKLLSYPMAPILARGRDVYPFMPVVTLGALGVLALGFAQGIL